MDCFFRLHIYLSNTYSYFHFLDLRWCYCCHCLDVIHLAVIGVCSEIKENNIINENRTILAIIDIGVIIWLPFFFSGSYLLSLLKDVDARLIAHQFQ